jgi:uncharacterized protein (TIRG00374 family)
MGKLKENVRPLIALVMLVGVFVFVGLHFEEASVSLAVLKDANPWWVALALVLQLLTYACSGGIFYEILRAAKRHIPLRRLAALSVERMSVNQIAPAAGLSGNVYVFMAFRRFDIPRGIAAEAVFMDTLSYHAGGAISTVLALGIILGLHAESPFLIGGLLIFLIVTAGILGGIFYIFSHTDGLPSWINRWSFLKEIARSLKSVRPERLQAPWVLSITTLYELLIFTLDSATLWAIMHIINVPIPFIIAFTVFTVASAAGALSLLPGGIGGFEAACVLALRWFSVGLGPALTATLLLRALTLWLPLIPGSIFAAKYVMHDSESEFGGATLTST